MIRALKKIKSHGLFLVVGLFYLYLIFHGISGRRGVFKLAQYDAQIAELQSRIVKVQGERLTLERHASQLKSSELNLDRLEQRSRELLSVSHAKDMVIILDE